LKLRRRETTKSNYSKTDKGETKTGKKKNTNRVCDKKSVQEGKSGGGGGGGGGQGGGSVHRGGLRVTSDSAQKRGGAISLSSTHGGQQKSVGIKSEGRREVRETRRRLKRGRKGGNTPEKTHSKKKNQK